MKRPSTVFAVVAGTVGSPLAPMKAGSMPRRSQLAGVVPLAQTGKYSFAAAAWLNWSGRKFEACSVVSHCGVR